MDCCAPVECGEVGVFCRVVLNLALRKVTSHAKELSSVTVSIGYWCKYEFEK